MNVQKIDTQKIDMKKIDTKKIDTKKIDTQKINIEIFINEHKEELQQLLMTLARIPAPSGKEERRAEFCLNWLHAHGAEEAYVDQAGNVVYLYQKSEEVCMAAKRSEEMPDDLCRAGTGKDMLQYPKEKKTAATSLIVFDAHMDVVFPDETELPLYEQDGKVFCPGVGDDTANLAVLLMTAAYAAKYQTDTGGYGILFVCSVGEEGLGNLKGVREIAASFGNRIAAFYSFDLHLDAYTSKAVGSLRYRISVETRGGHSYGDFGNANAIAVLAQLVAQLYGIKVPERGKTTYNVGMISGGTSVNTIAQKAEMLYEIRSDDYEDLMEMKARFREVLAGYPVADKEFVEGVNIDRGNTGHGMADHGMTDHGMTGHEMSDYGMSDHGMSDHGMSDYGMSDHRMSDHEMTDHGMTGREMSDYGMSDHGMSDHQIADIESENKCREIVFEKEMQGGCGKQTQEDEFDRDYKVKSSRNWPEDIKILVEEIGERPCEKGVDEEKRNWLFAQAERIFEQVTGKVPKPVPCSTNCNIPLSLGIPSICVGMCDGAGAHTREEYVVKESLVKGMEVALKLLNGKRQILGRF